MIPSIFFDTYCVHDVYGREEFGFRNDPKVSGGKKNKRAVRFG